MERKKNYKNQNKKYQYKCIKLNKVRKNINFKIKKDEKKNFSKKFFF